MPTTRRRASFIGIGAPSRSSFPSLAPRQRPPPRIPTGLDPALTGATTTTALAALSFPFSSTASASGWTSLWNKPPATATTASTLPVALAAFVLGGIFTTFILPRLAQVAVHLWQYNGIHGKSRRKWSLKDRFRIVWQVFKLKKQATTQPNDDGNGKDETTATKKQSLKPLRRRRRDRRRGKTQIKFKRKPLGRQGLVLPQYVLSKLIRRSLQTQFRRALTENLSVLEQNPNIGSVTLQSLEFLSTPKLFRGWYYDIPPHDDDDDNNNKMDLMRLEGRIAWRNALDLRLELTTQRLGLVVPLHIYNVDVLGTVCWQLAPLIDDPPGFGAILTSFVDGPPAIQNLQIDVADGAVVTTSKLPWLRDALIGQIQSALASNLVWPERIVQPSRRPNVNETILDDDELQILQSIDPLLQLEQHQKEKQRMEVSRSSSSEGVEEREDAIRKDGDTTSQAKDDTDEKDDINIIFGDMDAWAELVERVGEVFEND